MQSTYKINYVISFTGTAYGCVSKYELILLFLNIHHSINPLTFKNRASYI
jgi:hypothetical protein